jgi:D-serine deaminase-like pyridoxal phosphate-dependent protein
MRPDTLSQLETPALVLDADVLDRNVARMAARLAHLGVTPRPHVKTPKSIEVSRSTMSSPQGPITVSTLKEAEVYFSHGVTDVLYAVPIAPGKLAHAADLRQRGADLSILVESAGAAHAVASAQREFSIELPVLIEIDSDGHRSGVRPGDPLLLETHCGSSYQATTPEALRAKAEEERLAVVTSAAALRAAGHAAPIVSVGSTPTALFAEHLDGVTEVRAGVYVFFDLVLAGIGVCGLDEIAISVLASVIGHRADRGWLITDAGWMAMSRDRGTARQAVDQGYGVVCDLDGQPIPDLIVADATQEHGIVTRRDGAPLDVAAYPVGSLLRILPNHACATAAQFSEYQVVRGGRTVEAVWPRFGGW